MVDGIGNFNKELNNEKINDVLLGEGTISRIIFYDSFFLLLMHIR